MIQNHLLFAEVKGPTTIQNGNNNTVKIWIIMQIYFYFLEILQNWQIRKSLNLKCPFITPVCPRSSCTFYIVSYKIKWVINPWTYNHLQNIRGKEGKREDILNLQPNTNYTPLGGWCPELDGPVLSSGEEGQLVLCDWEDCAYAVLASWISIMLKYSEV